MSKAHQLPWLHSIHRRLRPKVEAMLPAPCIRCGKMIGPKDQWDVGHRTDLAELERIGQLLPGNPLLLDVGPEHRRCNRSAGGRRGADKTNGVQQARVDMRLFDW